MTALRRPAIAGLAVVVAVAAVATLPALGNGFAYDDIPIIVENTALHAPGTLPGRLLEPYWPGGLYRPITLALLGLEWQAGGGSPVLFHAVSIVVYAALAGMLVILALELGAPLVAAVAGGLVFAVHPVHSEVTANVVGQAELVSAFWVLAMLLLYVRARRRGGPNGRDTAGILGCFLLALHAKESGYVAAGLLVAVEFLVVPHLVAPPLDRSRLRAPALLLLATSLAALAVRALVLGAVGGETPHLSWEGMGAGARALAMLAVVPEWARLLLWPARLQAEYGPPALVPNPAVGAQHLTGILLIGATVGLAAWAWRHSRVAAFGLAWMILALGPVANVVFPTGIILAERTLFLPSAGLALAVAGLTDWGSRRLVHPAARGVALFLGAIVLGIGATRLASRQDAWQDSYTILSRTVHDAPEVYRAHLMLGKELLRGGDRDAAREAFAQAGALWDRDPRPFEELGQLLRADGQCTEAIPVLRRGVLADSTSDTARSRLVECLLVERRWDEAEVEVRRGLAQGVIAYRNALQRIETGRAAGKAPNGPQGSNPGN